MKGQGRYGANSGGDAGPGVEAAARQKGSRWRVPGRRQISLQNLREFAQESPTQQYTRSTCAGRGTLV